MLFRSPTITRSASCVFDTKGFYSNDKTSIIASDDLYLFGILNSTVSDFFIHLVSSTKQGGYFEYKPMYIEQIPIRTINKKSTKDKNLKERIISKRKSIVKEKRIIRHNIQGFTKTDYLDLSEELNEKFLDQNRENMFEAIGPDLHDTLIESLSKIEDKTIKKKPVVRGISFK